MCGLNKRLNKKTFYIYRKFQCDECKNETFKDEFFIRRPVFEYCYI
jgi:hypothetical protein